MDTYSQHSHAFTQEAAEAVVWEECLTKVEEKEEEEVEGEREKLAELHLEEQKHKDQERLHAVEGEGQGGWILGGGQTAGSAFPGSGTEARRR